jgi:hypothetical protein
MPASQINVEYWFRLLYECFHGSCHGGTVDASQFSTWLAHFWLWIVVIGYVLAVLALIVIIYSIVRLFELRKREEEFYSTLLVPQESEGGVHPRWVHIQSLVNSVNPNDWRTAIIEADILLDDQLSRRGYVGADVGEKLKSADRLSFHTLQDAWEAHKVRNQIAHEGSAFDLSEGLMRRTIAHYEAVFREFKII